MLVSVRVIRVYLTPRLDSRNVSTEGEVFESISRAKDAADKILSPYVVELPSGTGYAWFSAEQGPPRGSKVITRLRWLRGLGYQRQGWKDVRHSDRLS